MLVPASALSCADFNPRSPRRERHRRVYSIYHKWRFQSTLPAKGATLPGKAAIHCNGISIHAPREGSDRIASWRTPKFYHFNPRSPRRERRKRRSRCVQQILISIHAPREGSDIHDVNGHYQIRDFNPRSPRRERPRRSIRQTSEETISIHAPREGSDIVFIIPIPAIKNFNPRSPRRERRCPRYRPSKQEYFNPRSPRRERPPVAVTFIA